MTSLIQQNVLLLDRMSSLELQCIEELIRSRLNSSRSTAESLPSATHLRSLPQEIRDSIYYFVGQDHLLQLRKVKDNHRRPTQSPFHPLLLVNKQIRHEFKNFFYSRHMIKAVYFDDDTKTSKHWFRVPPWLLEELFRSKNRHECYLEWPYLSPHKVGKVVRQDVASDRARDRVEDRDVEIGTVFPGEKEDLENYRSKVHRAEAAKFHGFLDIAGHEWDPSRMILATLHFEKYLLSEDLWFKVKDYDKEGTLWARTARYRKESVTTEQRLRAIAKAQNGDRRRRVPERAKTRHFPREVKRGEADEEFRGLTPAEKRESLEKGSAGKACGEDRVGVQAKAQRPGKKMVMVRSPKSSM